MTDTTAAKTFDAICILADAAGGSSLLDLPLDTTHKVTDPDGSSRWVGVEGATGWGIVGGTGEGYDKWHISTMPGLSIVLSGAWEIEASSGEKRLLETGSILVMLDNHGQGHRSRTVRAPCVVMGVTLDAPTHARIRAQAEALSASAGRG